MTIIAGGSRSNARHFAWYFQRDVEGQTAAIRDVVGLMGHDMDGWFEQLEAMAQGGNTDNFLYHFSVNPRDDEPFTDDQVDVSVRTTLRNLGLERQPYFVIEHDKEGRSPHYHCIVLRVDLDTGKAISDSHNFRVHQRTADELERLFGHERTKREREPQRRKPKDYEVPRGKDTKIDVKDLDEQVTALYRQCDSGQAFAAALEASGLILAKGDRRDYVIVDAAGDTHSLARTIDGAKAAEVRERLKGLDRESLPSVEEARKLARSRAAQRDRDDEVKQPDPAPPPADPAPKRDHEAFETLAEELVHAAKDAVSERTPPPIADVPTTEATAFDHLAQELAHDAREPVPVAEGLAVAAALVEGAHVAKELLDTAKDTIAGETRVAPSSADIPKSEPAPQPTAFERLARKLTEAFGGGPKTAESLDVPAQPAAPLSGLPGHPLPGTFEHLATELLRDAKETAPIVGELTAATAIAETEPSAFERVAQNLIAHARAPLPVPETPLDPIERLGREVMANMREGAPVAFSADAEAWPDQIAQAMRSKGGDGRSFWQRSLASLAAMRDRLTGSLRDAFQRLSTRFFPERNDRNKGIER